MKKFALIPVIAAVAAIIVFASCSKRDYTCTCTYNDIGGVLVKDVSTVTGTSTKAKNACDTHEANLKYYAKGNVSCTMI